MGPGPGICLVFQRKLSKAETSESPAKGKLSSAYALLVVKKNKQKTGPWTPAYKDMTLCLAPVFTLQGVIDGSCAVFKRQGLLYEDT